MHALLETQGSNHERFGDFGVLENDHASALSITPLHVVRMHPQKKPFFIPRISYKRFKWINHQVRFEAPLCALEDDLDCLVLPILIISWT